MKAPTTGFVAMSNAEDVSTNPVVRVAPAGAELPELFKLACFQSPMVPPVVVLNFTKTQAASQLPITVAFRHDAFQETLKVTVVLPPLRAPRVGLVTLISAQVPSLGIASAKRVIIKRGRSLLITSINGSF